MTQTPQTNKDLHFKGQYADEVVIAFFREHWITLLPHIVVHVVFAACIVTLFLNFFDALLAFFSTPIGEIVLIAAVLVSSYFIHAFYIRLINYFLNMVIISNIRIVEIQKMVFIKDLQISLDMSMIQDVEKKQNGIIKNILNFGELTVVLSSSDTRTIRFVPNPNFHFRLINRLKLEYRQKHQGIKDHQRPHQPILYENFSFSPGQETQKPVNG